MKKLTLALAVMASLASGAANAIGITGGASFGFSVASFLPGSPSTINTATSVTLGSGGAGIATGAGSTDLSNIAFGDSIVIDPNGAAAGLTLNTVAGPVNYLNFLDFTSKNWAFDALIINSVIGNIVSGTQWSLTVGVQGVLRDKNNVLDATPADMTLSFTQTGTALSGSGTLSSPASCTINDSCVTTSVPEIDAISGTGALTLMAGALALAGERRRRRS